MTCDSSGRVLGLRSGLALAALCAVSACTPLIGDLSLESEETVTRDEAGADAGALLPLPGERYVYDDADLPRATPPEMGGGALTDAGDLDGGIVAEDAGGDPSRVLDAVPFEQSGRDTGQAGIVYAAALAGYYILRVQDADVGYHYEYDPTSAQFNEGDNVHRKSGATFTLAWLYRVTEREEFRLGTLAGLQYLTGRGEWRAEGTEFMLRDLGATALISLSLTEYAKLTQTDEWDAHIDGAGAYVLNRVNADGSFSEGKPLVWAQCHQALWRLYSHTGDERYVEALERVARYFYDHRDDSDIFGSAYLYGLWANEPLSDLYAERPQGWIRDLVLEVGDEVATEQFDEDSAEDARWVGGYWGSGDPDMPNWNSTLKLEAVIDAYRMAVASDDEERIQRFGRSALLGAEFLMRLQLRRGETDAYPDPDFALGGVPFSFDDPIVRVDVPHHMANAILKVALYLDLEDFPGRELQR